MSTTRHNNLLASEIVDGLEQLSNPLAVSTSLNKKLIETNPMITKQIIPMIDKPNDCPFLSIF